jgi:hypothetical protein
MFVNTKEQLLTSKVRIFIINRQGTRITIP